MAKTNGKRREANREKIARLEALLAEKEREIGRLRRWVLKLEQEKDASEKAGNDALDGYLKMCKAYCALVIRMALAYGEETEAEWVTKRLRIPVADDEDKLTAMYTSIARKDEEKREVIIDVVADAELAVEAAAYQEARDGTEH